jgi:rubredoxin
MGVVKEHKIIDQVEHKHCYACDKWNTLDSYNKSKSNLDGLDNRCRACCLEYRKKNREKKRLYNEKYRKEKSEQIKAQRAKNKEKTAAYNKQYRENNKELVQSYYKKTDQEKAQNKATRQLKYFNKFVKIAEQCGGTCLSKPEEYETAHTKLTIKCKEGHEFKISYNNLSKSRYCPECNFYIGEEYTRHVLETLLDCKFQKIRPDWLLNEEGNKLELDGYNEDLKVAFEYNGIQHYKFSKHFHRTKANFNKRLRDDQLKIETCKNNDVNLIVVPYTLEIEDIRPFVEKELKKFKVPFKSKKIKVLDQNTLRKNSASGLSKIKKKIEGKGKLLSKVYIDRNTTLKFKCNCSNEWETRAKNILRDLWCPKCGVSKKKVAAK